MYDLLEKTLRVDVPVRICNDLLPVYLLPSNVLALEEVCCEHAQNDTRGDERTPHQQQVLHSRRLVPRRVRHRAEHIPKIGTVARVGTGAIGMQRYAWWQLRVGAVIRAQLITVQTHRGSHARHRPARRKEDAQDLEHYIVEREDDTREDH